MRDRIALRARARHELESKVKVLNETVWEENVGEPTIRDWLNNFCGDVLEVEEERLHALFLLSNVTYFGQREIRALLKALFRDKFKYPIVRDIRRRNGGTLDAVLLEAEFKKQLDLTRFVPLGDPAESGSMIAYYFRQENGLSKRHFTDRERLIVQRLSHSTIGRLLAWLQPGRYLRTRRNTQHVVFVDDFAGTGHQAEQYAGKLVRDLKRIDPNIKTTYLVLATTEKALEYLRGRSVFDAVEAAVILNESDRCTNPTSRIFQNPQVEGISPEHALAVATGYGAKHFGKQNALGYGGGGWLLSFTHNTPDNTLPIFWSDQDGWEWVLKRHQKH